MALCTVGTGRWCIGVDVLHRGHHREVYIGVTRSTRRTGRRRNVVGWHGSNTEAGGTGVAVRAVPRGRMVGIRDAVGAPTSGGTSVETNVARSVGQCRRRTRIQVHPQPG